MVYNSLLALTTSHSDSISAASQTDPHLKTRLLEVVRKRLKGWEVELTEYAIDAVRRACDGEAAARGIEESKGHDERASKTPEPTPPPKSLPELRIAKVKSVLPDLGEGYIELAIACYGGVGEDGDVLKYDLRLRRGQYLTPSHPPLPQRVLLRL